MNRDGGNLLDPDHIRAWRWLYEAACARYAHGGLTRFQAYQMLMKLGYRGEAHDIELLEWDRARREWLGPELATVRSSN